MSVYNQSSASASATASSGIGLSTIGVITGVVLCILKACGVLTISWFWATFPFWIVPATYIAVILIVLLVTIIISIFEKE